MSSSDRTSSHKISSVADLSKDLASRQKSYTSASEQPFAEQIQADFETLKRQGYVIIENLLSTEQIESIRNLVSPLLNNTGQNNFEGLKTQRVYNILEQTTAIDGLAVHPRVTGLLETLFEPHYLPSQITYLAKPKLTTFSAAKKHSRCIMTMVFIGSRAHDRRLVPQRFGRSMN